MFKNVLVVEYSRLQKIPKDFQKFPKDIQRCFSYKLLKKIILINVNM